VRLGLTAGRRRFPAATFRAACPYSTCCSSTDAREARNLVHARRPEPARVEHPRPEAVHVLHGDPIHPGVAQLVHEERQQPR
jgi:hypothetical protein